MDRIKNLHISTGANYVTVNGFTKLINENFDPDDHFFIVRDEKTNPLQQVSQFDNVLFMPRADTEDFRELLTYMKRAEHVYFHSMGFGWRFQLQMLLRPQIMKKTTWIEWGADLFDWKRTDGQKIATAVVNKITKTWREKVASVVVIYPADEKVYRESFNPDMKIFHAIYSLYYHEDMERSKPEVFLNDGLCHVLVGHSAVKNCHHFECLEALSHFKDEKIVLHIPLTYGDMAYRDEVIAFARERFPEEKLDFILENMPLDDYARFLWNVDVGVFKVYRQIALGNICKLLYMCKKVYLPKGSLMYDCFTEKETEVYDFGAIKDMTFDEFSAPCKNQTPSDYMMGRMTKERVLDDWRKVFENN